MANAAGMTDEQYSAKFLREQVDTVTKRLRALADQIDREAAYQTDDALTGSGQYARVPASLIHTIQWGIANINLTTLIQTAADADIAHAKGA